MNETISQNTQDLTSIKVASTRLDRAMARLEAIAKVQSDQSKIIRSLQGDVENLSHQNAKIGADLERSKRRENKLDKSASEVSKRLVKTMETIKSVLVN